MAQVSLYLHYKLTNVFDQKKQTMPTYDLQDPTDLDIMRGTFDSYTSNDWEKYIDQATANNMGYKNINALNTAQKKTGLSKFLSPKMIQWVLNLVEELDAKHEKEGG